MGGKECGGVGGDADNAGQALQVIAAVDTALLLLPLFVLASGAGRGGDHSLAPGACGWSPATLSTLCVLAVCCLCFSLLLVAGQLVALGTSNISSPGRRRAFARRLLRDLPLPLLGTAAGGAIGAYTLWGQAALSSGECSAALQVFIPVAFAGSYLLCGYYALLSRWVFTCHFAVTPADDESAFLPVAPPLPSGSPPPPPNGTTIGGAASEQAHGADGCHLHVAKDAGACGRPCRPSQGSTGSAARSTISAAGKGGGHGCKVLCCASPSSLDNDPWARPSTGAQSTALPSRSDEPKAEYDVEAPEEPALVCWHIEKRRCPSEDSIEDGVLVAVPGTVDLSVPPPRHTPVPLQDHSGKRKKVGTPQEIATEDGDDGTEQGDQFRIDELDVGPSISLQGVASSATPASGAAAGAGAGAGAVLECRPRLEHQLSGSSGVSGVSSLWEPDRPAGDTTEIMNIVLRRQTSGQSAGSVGSSFRGGNGLLFALSNGRRQSGLRRVSGIDGQACSPRAADGKEEKSDRFEDVFMLRRSLLSDKTAQAMLDSNAARACSQSQTPVAAAAALALKRAVGSAAKSGEPESASGRVLLVGSVPEDGEEEGPQCEEPERSSYPASSAEEGRDSLRVESERETVQTIEDDSAKQEESKCEKPETRYSILVSEEKRNIRTGGRKAVCIKVDEVEECQETSSSSRRPSSQPKRKLLHAPGEDNDRRHSDHSLIDMQVLHYVTSPINFDSLSPKPREGSSDEENDDDSNSSQDSMEKDEFWSEPLEQQVEVPVWLLERLKAQAEAEGKEDRPAEDAPPEEAQEEDGEDEDDSREQDDEDDIGELPARSASIPATSASAEPRELKKRISFHDQVTGTSFEKYSKNRSTIARVGPVLDAKAKSVQLAVRSKSETVPPAAATFWKIPMPTRKNTMMPALALQPPTGETIALQLSASEKTGAATTGPDEEKKANATPAPEVEAAVLPSKLHVKSAPTMAKQRKSLLKVGGPLEGRVDRRPSVLGVFSNDGAKAAGLYALPKNEEMDGPASELVEVKRRSIIMSTGMLNEILKSKVDDDRFQAIKEDEEKGPSTDEVVLPFFSAAKSAFRQCHCQTDPETGFVIHTCMTPAATQCDNTQAFQSFVCSAWGSRRNSRTKSGEANALARSSRHGSFDEEEEDGDFHAPLPALPVLKNGKRIRNASMLAIVGAVGPAPQKQNTDATLREHSKAKGAKKTAAEDSDGELPEENELSVSFKNISSTPAPTGDQEPVSSHSTERRFSAAGCYGTATDCFSEGLDQKVENDLGHRFDLVEPWQLAAWLKNRDMREQILTVDVRGRDWVGGHIPLSVNLRTSEVVRHPESLVVQCVRNRIHHLIFTCMYSVLRARKSALAVAQAQVEAQKSGLQTYRIRISLLAGGMHAWVNQFIRIAPQKAMVQDFDAECWSDGGPSQGGLVHVMDALWSSGGQKALSDALTAELSTLLLTRGREESREGSRRNSEDATVPS